MQVTAFNYHRSENYKLDRRLARQETVQKRQGEDREKLLNHRRFIFQELSQQADSMMKSMQQHICAKLGKTQDAESFSRYIVDAITQLLNTTLVQAQKEDQCKRQQRQLQFTKTLREYQEEVEQNVRVKVAVREQYLYALDCKRAMSQLVQLHQLGEDMREFLQSYSKEVDACFQKLGADIHDYKNNPERIAVLVQAFRRDIAQIEKRCIQSLDKPQKPVAMTN
jgi:hypothetical protein